jgi:hypothetical protein
MTRTDPNVPAGDDSIVLVRDAAGEPYGLTVAGESYRLRPVPGLRPREDQTFEVLRMGRGPTPAA